MTEPSDTQAAIVVGGTVAIDHVKTPSSEGRDLLGGSASYAALAASFFAKRVELIGIVGHDFPVQHLDMLAAHGVSLAGVERSESASFTWSGEYMQNMNERVTHSVAVNVLESWQVKVPASAQDCSIVVLANMAPENQLEMLAQCPAQPRFVIADTMDLWISIAQERLHDVLKKLDLFVINEGEARELAGTSNLVEAGRILRSKGPRYVVVKLGEFGAMLFGPGSEESISPENFFRSAAYPLETLADPTGAGDTFLGGMAGYLSAYGAGPYDFATIRQAIVHGSVLASYTCEAFSTHRLESLQQEDLRQRLADFQAMTHW
jgi:cytidine kinase